MRPERRPNQSTLPTEASTHSFWHQDPPPHLLGHRTTDDLPDNADVVVVGSGITGVFAAMTLMWAGREVIMLEAREACWGATGRNGGHCQPILYRSSPEVCEFELGTFRLIEDMIKSYNIKCDWKVTGGIYALSTEKAVSEVEEHLARLEKTHPHLTKLCKVVRDQETLRELDVKGAKGAVTQVYAAKCWPYKFVTFMLDMLLSMNSDSTDKQAPGCSAPPPPFNLQTKTPVTHLQRAGESWIVHTPRGQISSGTVVLCTNAYTSALLPEMTNLIIPVRGQVAALTPPREYTPLNMSHAFDGHATGSEDYLIQRDDDNGTLIFGGERFAAKGYELGVSDDSTIDESVAKALRCALPGQVDLTSPRSAGGGGGRDGTASKVDDDCLDARYEWTGIMGYSGDHAPWVGAVPPKLGGGDGGLWISAGYTGHGMPVAARCGIAVADMILGRQDGGDKVPAGFEITEERVDRVRNGKAGWEDEDAGREPLTALRTSR